MTHASDKPCCPPSCTPQESQSEFAFNTLTSQGFGPPNQPSAGGHFPLGLAFRVPLPPFFLGFGIPVPLAEIVHKLPPSHLAPETLYTGGCSKYFLGSWSSLHPHCWQAEHPPPSDPPRGVEFSEDWVFFPNLPPFLSVRIYSGVVVRGCVGLPPPWSPTA